MRRGRTVTSIGLRPLMSFTAAMIRPGRLVKEHHRHIGNVLHPEMYVIYTGSSSSGLSHDQYLYIYKTTNTHNYTGVKSVMYARFDFFFY